MSKYTATIRELCDLYGRDEVESWFTSYEINDFLNQKQASLINKMGVWNKEKLAKKIVDHYYMREIGFETPGLFAHYAKVYMREIMERKLPLIYSNSFDYDPLTNIDYTETYERRIDNGTSFSTSSSGNGSNLQVNSDTPQGQINKQAILGGSYASSTTANEGETSTSDTGSSTSGTDENYTKKIKGNMGILSTYQNLIKQYRQVIVAIDEQIINELNKLFMGLF